MRNLQTYSPNFVSLAKVLQLKGYENLPHLEKDIQYLIEKLDVMGEEKRKKEGSWLAFSVYNKIVQN